MACSIGRALSVQPVERESQMTQSGRTKSRISKIARGLLAAAVLTAPMMMAQTASAQRHGGGGHPSGGASHSSGGPSRGSSGPSHFNGGSSFRGNDRGGSWSHGRYDNHGRTSFGLSLNFGVPYHYYYPSYAYSYPSYYSAYPAYYNSYGLGPNQCRTEIRYDYFRGRPADIQVRICADYYGEVYTVAGSERLIRWRY